MDLNERTAVRRNLKRQGFDLTTSSPRDGGSVRPRCSQCAVLVICGAACHETHCPRQPRRRNRR